MAVSITRQEVLSILALQGQEQEQAVSTFETLAARQFRAQDKKSEQARGSASEAAALGTHLAERTGVLIEKGVKKGKGVPGMTGQEWADKFGVSGGLVTQWRTMGYALVVCGVETTFDDDADGGKSTWRLLIGSAGAGAVSEAVYAKGATPETIRAAILTVREPDGKVKRGDSKRKSTPRDNDKGDLSADERLATDPVGTGLEALRIVRAALRAIPLDNSEGFSKVEDAMRAILQETVDERVKAATAARMEANSNVSGRSGTRRRAAKKSA